LERSTLPAFLAAKLESFGHILGLDGRAALQVGQRSSHSENAVMSAPRQSESIDGFLEKRSSAVPRTRHDPELGGAQGGIQTPRASDLAQPGSFDALPDEG
jgi:hypothetical protein